MSRARPDAVTLALGKVEVSASRPTLMGVSGGRDSIALLHALAVRGCRELTVCHLDHGMREASAAEARFVEELASQYGLPCVVERRNVAESARVRGISLETAGREARYSFFAKVAREKSCHRLLLAHHADDQVETFLFNLLRGSGPGGLQGMQWQSAREVEGTTLEIERPLLGTWRREIDAYVAQHQLDFREDDSNADRRHTRNRIRHEILPMLESAFGRDVRNAVWRSAEILRADEELVVAFPGLCADLDAEPSVADLRAIPVAAQRRLLLRWLRAQGVSDVSFDDVETVRRLLTDERPAKVNLAGGVHARRRAGHLFLEFP